LRTAAGAEGAGAGAGAGAFPWSKNPAGRADCSAGVDAAAKAAGAAAGRGTDCDDLRKRTGGGSLLAVLSA